MKIQNLLVILLSFCILTLSGCGSDDSGRLANSIPLPADSLLTLYCANEGIYPETCVLDDPENPYRMVAVNEETKWDLNNSPQSAKSRFYLWATALARTPTGENQYYVADSLHELYTNIASVNSHEQAKRAYRSVLDNFYDSFTYWEATWLPGPPVYAVPLKDLTGMRIYDPTPDGLLPLYIDSYYGLDALAEWGYAYDPDFDPTQSLTQTGTVTKTNL